HECMPIKHALCYQGNKALKDSGVDYADIQQAVVGYCYGDTTCGQRALYQLGLTGIPIYNVNNACATGSSALFLAKQLIEGGISDCILALGFEKMERGSLGAKYTDRTSPIDKHLEVMLNKHDFAPGHLIQRVGIVWPFNTERWDFHTPECILQRGGETLDENTWKNTVVRKPIKYNTIEPLQNSQLGMKFSTTLDHFAKIAYKNHFTFCQQSVGYDMTKAASQRIFSKTGKGGEFVDRGDNTYGGQYVINPSGGLISKGHPLGATGLAQCTELCLQLRGECGKRQVAGARVGLQHNLGLGGAVIIALYRLGFPQQRFRPVTAYTSASSPDGFKAKAVFDEIEKQMKSDGANYVKKIKGVFCFKIQKGPNNEGVWIVDAKNGTGSVKFGSSDKADVTITINDDNFVKLMTGKLNPQTVPILRTGGRKGWTDGREEGLDGREGGRVGRTGGRKGWTGREEGLDGREGGRVGRTGGRKGWTDGREEGLDGREGGRVGRTGGRKSWTDGREEGLDGREGGRVGRTGGRKSWTDGREEGLDGREGGRKGWMDGREGGRVGRREGGEDGRLDGTGGREEGLDGREGGREGLEGDGRRDGREGRVGRTGGRKGWMDGREEGWTDGRGRKGWTDGREEGLGRTVGREGVGWTGGRKGWTDGREEELDGREGGRVGWTGGREEGLDGREGGRVGRTGGRKGWMDGREEGLDGREGGRVGRTGGGGRVGWTGGEEEGLDGREGGRVVWTGGREEGLDGREGGR
ncbi:hypothetical protein QZH41_014603, partial [Actinostola sp. cb2023]